jgi:hypothetical protein
MYSIGGVLQGLDGANARAFTLQNNRTDNLQVVSNGSFSFATRMPGGAAYEVTIGVLPVGYECSVSNSKGSVSSQNVTTVVVACAPEQWSNWRTPPVSPPDSQYVRVGDVVTDVLTGLDWVRSVPDAMYTLDGANQLCGALVLGGYSDWRLPTLIELASIVSFGVGYPAINATAFPGTPVGRYWVASDQIGNDGYCWTVDFWTGEATSVSKQGSPDLHVRCVR